MITPYPNPQVAARRNLSLRIERTLASFEKTGREPDRWEVHHVLNALGMLTLGDFTEGERAMLLAEREPEKRGGHHAAAVDASTETATAEDLRIRLVKALAGEVDHRASAAPGFMALPLYLHSGEHSGHLFDDRDVIVGLGKKDRPSRKLSLHLDWPAGRNDQVYRGPPFPNVVRELQAVDSAGHFNIGEYEADFRPCFQDSDGFIGIRSPHAFKTSGRDEV
jgi:hypothetical protein